MDTSMDIAVGKIREESNSTTYIAPGFAAESICRIIAERCTTISINIIGERCAAISIIGERCAAICWKRDEKDSCSFGSHVAASQYLWWAFSVD